MCFMYSISRSVANPNQGFQIQLQDFEQYKLNEVHFALFVAHIHHDIVAVLLKSSHI